MLCLETVWLFSFQLNDDMNMPGTHYISLMKIPLPPGTFPAFRKVPERRRMFWKEARAFARMHERGEVARENVREVPAESLDSK